LKLQTSFEHFFIFLQKKFYRHAKKDIFVRKKISRYIEHTIGNFLQAAAGNLGASQQKFLYNLP
jgi:hypothetical protein